MDNKTSDSHHDSGETPAVTDNRRRWARYETTTEEIVLTVGWGKRNAVVVNQSIGGLGLQLTNIRKLSPGVQIKACYRGVDIVAEVKSIRPDEDGTYAVGVGWLDTGLISGRSSPTPRKDKAVFVCRTGVWLVCELLEESANGRSTIVQWDSSYFEVSSSDLTEKTVEQRSEELASLGNDVNLLAALYRLGDQGTAEKTCNAILDYEFAIKPAF